ncbi:hypothetical protein ACFFLE_00600 [Salinicoccus siamensis]|uniref:Sodium:solute symporter family protein n=2 Tax=Salinicoccus siamensis TaxID=381830 RepID=A0ABV5Z0L9_9STAP
MISVWAVTVFGEISWLWNNMVGAVVAIGVGYLVSMVTPAPAAEKIQGLTLGKIQEGIVTRAETAESVDVVEEEKETTRWPIYLVIYFFIVIAFLLYLQNM